MKVIVIVVALVAVVFAADGQNEDLSADTPIQQSAVSLPEVKSIQTVENYILKRSSLVRKKRQFGFGGFGFGSSNANANAFSNSFGPKGFGSSASNAQAQSFGSSGPLGSFGASAANSASQGFGFGPNGLTGAASFAGSQTYKLPGGKDLSVSYSNGFSIGKKGPTFSRGQSISFG